MIAFTNILTQTDTDIFICLNGFHNSYFDEFMYLFSGRFIWIPMYAGLLFMMMRRYQLAKVLIFLIGIALAITLSDQICSSIIRPVFERLRPSNLQNPLSEITHIVNNYRGGAYGFPSCHAANSFALAAFSALMIARKPFSIFIFSWAIINSYSRIYLGVHYPGDLLIGGVIGASIGCLCYYLCAWCFRTNQKFISCTPLLGNCGICNKIESTFRFLPDNLKCLGAMGFIALFTLIYILLSSAFT